MSFEYGRRTKWTGSIRCPSTDGQWCRLTALWRQNPSAPLITVTTHVVGSPVDMYLRAVLNQNLNQVYIFYFYFTSVPGLIAILQPTTEGRRVSP